MNNLQAIMTASAVALADSAVKGFIKEPPVKNYGFAGNTMDGHPNAVSKVSAAFTGLLFAATLLAPKKAKLPLAMILGGGISNSLDRLIRGYVVDYIPMGGRVYGNLSDLSIFAGTLLGTAMYLFEEDNDGQDKDCSISGT